MEGEPLVFTIFLVFTGAALLGTVALYARQSLLVVYIVLGIIMGPSGVMLVTDPVLIKHISHIGIIFLLFLLGMNLPPAKLIQLAHKTTIITAISSLLFGVIGFGVGIVFGYTPIESIIIAVSLIFSSTIHDSRSRAIRLSRSIISISLKFARLIPSAIRFRPFWVR